MFLVSRVPVPDMCTLSRVGARGVHGAQSTLELWRRAGETVPCTTPTRTAFRLPWGSSVSECEATETILLDKP